MITDKALTELAEKLVQELKTILTENGAAVEVKREKDNIVIVALRRKVKVKIPSEL